MKIVVTGASGFLGREAVLSALRRSHRVVAIGGSRPPAVRGTDKALQLDLALPHTLENGLLEEFPDAIINCAAIAVINTCRDAPERAAALNTELPMRLAMIANHLSARLIHISTDMVFDGQRGNYAHTDTPAPINLYGRTKAAGEKEVLQHGKKNAVVVRVPLLSGNSANGDYSLHERLLTQWAAGTVTPLFDDEIRQPTAASNLADAAVELCERDTLSGIYHWAGEEALSRYEIGRRIAEHFGLSPEKHIVRTTMTDTGGTERRPRNLSMNLHPLRGKLRTPVQNFDTILDELQIPPQLAAWHTAQTSRTTVRRLVKGRDF